MIRSGFLFFVCCFILSSSVFAQEDYFRHRKVFDICSIQKQCNDCYSCGKEDRCKVVLHNNTDKKITGIYYKFYSPVFNKIIEKEAKVEGSKIPSKENGIVYVCVLDTRHWVFSRVEYADETSTAFVLHGHMQNYLQEPDECDCNDQ